MSALLTSAGERQVIVSLGRLGLPGTLAWPEHPSGLVLFAHGSGSASHSIQAVARQLRGAGLATLLFDLLTTRRRVGAAPGVFEIPLMAARLRAATDWAVSQPEVASCRPATSARAPARLRRS